MAELDASLVDRAVEEAISSAANLDFFFDSLSSPAWIAPLAQRRLFSEPPEQFIDEQGYVRAQGWSASRYLARMAALDPEAVTRAVLSIDTNNERVHEDFVDAALVMPPEFGRQVAALERDFLRSLEHVYYSLPNKIAALAEHMASVGDVKTALELARELFSFSSNAHEDALGTKRLQPRVSDWQYDHLLVELTGKLVGLAPRQLLTELVLRLGQALDLLRPDEGDADHFDLITRIWWVRVADDRHRAVRLEGSLVSAVRDVAREIHESSLLSDQELVDILLARAEELFERLAMDALTREPDANLEVVRRLVVRPALIVDDPSVEFRELLEASASRLPRADIQSLVAAVYEGPDAEWYRGRMRDAFGRDATEDEVEQYVAGWKVGRLALLLTGLDDAELEEYRRLRAIAPDAELPVNFESRTFVGPTSPFTIEELAELDDDSLLEVLERWEPDDERIGPSREGLARALAAFAQADPSRVAELAPRLRDLRPAYVQWAFEGLTTALNSEGESFDWNTLIDLAEWVAEQPREIPGGRGDDYDDFDPGWVWTRRQVVSLLERGLDLQDERTLPPARRTSIWRIIQLIAEDPDPSPESEEKYGGSNMDPLTLALNTTRPRALFAAISYGHWLKRMLSPSSVESESDDFMSSEVPELAELLDKHLDPAVEPSVAVRAAIGHHYASLFTLDAGWAKTQALSIFPDDNSTLREAAWGAYVIYTHPFDDLFEPLRDVYERSAALAGEPGHGFRWDLAPKASLGDHLASFFWRGHISLDDDIFVTFWTQAPSDIRRHVVDFLGRSVDEFPQLEDDVKERLFGFCAFARERAVDAGAPDELAPLAWWMKSEALPARWRLDRLSDILDLDVKPDPVYAVIESLPTLAEREPADTVRVLRRILEIERGEWSYDLWDEQTFAVLRTAMASGDAEAYELAVETTHWLGSLGLRQYRELLS